MKKLYEKEAPLLQRKRIAFEINHEKKATPKRDEIIKQIASELKIDEKLITIRHIFTNFGENKSKIIIHIYKDEKRKKVIEKKKVKKGDKKPEEKKEAPKQEVKEDGKNKESPEKGQENKKEQKT